MKTPRKILARMSSRQAVAFTCVTLSLLLPGALGACSSQVEPGYLGESLTEVKGIIVDSPNPDHPITVDHVREGHSVGVSWVPFRGDYLSGTSLVRPGSPPQFTLNFYGPPPTDAMIPSWDGEQVVAFGHITLYAKDWFEGMIWRSGYSLDTLVIYFARDPTSQGDPVALTASAYGVPAKRGYHMVRMSLGDRQERDLCRWNGICEDRVCSGTWRQTNLWDEAWFFHPVQSLSSDGVVAEMWQRDFNLCQEALPSAPRCGHCPHLACGNCPSWDECPTVPYVDCGEPARTYEPNPDDRPLTVTITLGATLRNLIL